MNWGLHFRITISMYHLPIYKKCDIVNRLKWQRVIIIVVLFTIKNEDGWSVIDHIPRFHFTQTRCRDLHFKQFCLEDIAPAVLIILITHIIISVRWMLISGDKPPWRGNTVVSGGCHPNNNNTRKIDQKIRWGFLILWP